jgi:exodeoxyribonuclease-5
MRFTRHQEEALDRTGRWIRDPSSDQVFRLFGYAGTGKTTLAKYLVENAPGRWFFAAYTGKAAHVLRQKGCSGAMTIHSLIYRPAGESKKKELDALDYKIAGCRRDIEALSSDTRALADAQLEQYLLRLMRLRERVAADNEPQFALWANSPLAEYDVTGIVVDEVSMVDEHLARDLESFGKKVLVLGDPAQLPPVGGGGHYTSARPDVMLTEIHRQAEESGILRLATAVRNGGDYRSISSGDIELMSEEVWWSEARDGRYASREMNVFPQTLCGTNRTRRAMNVEARRLIEFDDKLPMVGDRLVCLKNNRSTGVYNGSQWRVLDVQSDETDVMDLELRDADGEDTEVRYLTAWTHRFCGRGAELDGMHHYDRREHDDFDFAYAMTVHKAQGSQWPEVVVYDQSRYFRRDARRWLYTAVTRAADRLVILS